MLYHPKVSNAVLMDTLLLQYECENTVYSTYV